ncbi:hypothetical protein KR009_001493 [Drosophila setifemur]|nr:hypothetical protein KR009_001493 [Drosophila setifemur]
MHYSLQAYLKYFAILGLVPWTANGPYYLFQRAYSMFLILINLVTFGVSMYLTQSGELFLSLLVNVVVFGAKIVCMTMILLQMMIQYEGYYVFFIELNCLEIRLPCEFKIVVGGLNWKCHIKIIGLCICCLVPILPSVYIAFNGSLLHFWSSLLPVITIRLQCILLLFYMDYLGHHVNYLGKRLKDVLNCHQTGEYCFVDGNCSQLRSLEFLMHLKKSHMKVYQLFNHFNSLFGWTILSIYVVMFLDSTLNLYWTQQVLAEVYETKYLYATFSVFVPSFVLIFGFCRCGDFSRRQNMLIGSYVRSLACNSQHFKEPAYNDLVSEFTLQVQHNSLAINAEGFVVIDNSFLMSVRTHLTS